MTMTLCRECTQPVSTEAQTCPHCGIAAPAGPAVQQAAPAPARKPSKIVLYGGGFIAVLFVLGLLSSIFGVKTQEQERKDQAAAAKEAAEAVPTNYDLPLQTTAGTLVCPMGVLFDRREGHGFRAALDTRAIVFGRLEAAQKAGCDEWREGIPVALSDEAIKAAKEFAAKNQCGMLPYEEVYVFSCELKNPPAAAQPGVAPAAPAPAPAQEGATGVSAGPLPASAVPNEEQAVASAIEPLAPDAPHLKWGAEATLAGNVHWGEFDNCCIQGQSTRTRYMSLTLRQPSVVDGDERYVAKPTVVRTVQIAIGDGLAGLKERRSVEIHCASLDSGDTGHYAEPVYCADPVLTHTD